MKKRYAFAVIVVTLAMVFFRIQPSHAAPPGFTLPPRSFPGKLFPLSTTISSDGTTLSVSGTAQGGSEEVECDLAAVWYTYTAGGIGALDNFSYSIDGAATTSFAATETSAGSLDFAHQNCAVKNGYADIIPTQYSFSLSLPISGLASGDHTVEVCAYDPEKVAQGQQLDMPTDGLDCWGASFEISGGIPTGATLTVSSTNSATGDLVASSWFLAGPGDPCDTLPCSGTGGVYPDLQAGNYTLAALFAPGFALGTVEKRSVAAGPGGLVPSLLAFAKTALVNIANAVSICDITNYQLVGNTYVCAGGSVPSLNVSSGTDANFIILWDPTASMFISPSSLNFEGTAGGANPDTQTLTVLNSGTIGSTLQWTSAPSDSWISVNPSADNTGLSAGNSEGVVVSVDTTGLAVGTHRGSVVFSGSSEPCGNPPCSVFTPPISVTLTVDAAAPTVSVTVSPSLASIPSGAIQQFNATVSPSSESQDVTWSVDGVTSGNAMVGTIDGTGLYTAPAGTGSHTVTATSVADSTKSGSATVTVTAAPPGVSVFVSPPAPSIQTNATQQFTASVSGSPGNTAVTWSVDGVTSGNATVGTIDGTGFYTAPGVTGGHTVTATSVADPAAFGNAQVTVTAPPPPSPIVVTPSPPQPVAVGVPIGVSCSGGTNSYTWSSASGNFDTTTGSSVTVSYPAQGNYPITCTDSGGGTGSTTVTVLPDCTINASPTTVVPPGTATLTWSCSPGTAVPNSCSITGVGIGLGTSGSTTVAPTTNTNYVLSCTANNSLAPSSQIPPASTTVTVQTSGIHETNP